MKPQIKVIHSGTPLGTLLFLVFLVLKLTGVIAWSWWWVTAPLWIPFAVFGAFSLGCLLVAGILLLIAKIVERFSK